METEQSKDQAEYKEILSILEKRSRSTRVTLITLVYILIVAASLVFMGVFYTKNNEDSAFGKVISSIMDSTSTLSESNSRLLKVLHDFNEQNQDILDAMSDLNKKSSGAYSTLGSADKIPRNDIMRGDSVYLRENNSQRIASSIASVLLSLSLMIFVGFVMKAILVFIRYYMQLGTDFENQKVAYLLSKGEVGPFNNILISLRSSNISFEKTPSLPQEKIILSLIDALKLGKATPEK